MKSTRNLRPVLFLVIAIIRGECKVCPHQSHAYTGPPRFTTDVGAADYVTIHQYYAIQCCGEGFEDVIWYKRNVTTHSWESYLPPGSDPLAPSLEEHKQVLSIKRARKEDEGTYKCVLKGLSEDISRTFTLYVDACVPLNHGPLLMAPAPRNTTVTSLGGVVHFPCIGYFGCGKDFRFMTWMVANGNSNDWQDVDGVSDRYILSESGREGELMSVNLTVSKVTEDDLSRKFMCVLATPQVVRGQISTVVTIQMKNRPVDLLYQGDMFWPVVIGAGVAIGIVIILLVVITVQARRHKQTIKQRYRTVEIQPKELYV